MSCDSVTPYIKFSYSVTRVADDNCSLENSTNWVFCESFFFKVYITCYWVYRILLTIVFNAVCDGELISIENLTVTWTIILVLGVDFLDEATTILSSKCPNWLIINVFKLTFYIWSRGFGIF